MPPPQPGRRSTQLGAGGADDEDRNVGGPVDEVVDEVEEPVVGPVDVLEDEHERPCLGERLEEAAPRREGLAAEVAARLLGAFQADQRAEVLVHPLRLDLVVHDRRDRRPELGGRLVGGVGLEDACLRLDHLPERPEAHALPVRQRAALAPAGEDLGVVVERRVELEQEPALADAGCADEGDELGRTLALGAGQRVPEEAQLLLPPDQLGAAAEGDVDTQPVSGRDHLPDADRLGLALGGHRLGVAVLDHIRGRPVGGLVDEDPVHRRRGLKAGARVDDVSGGHALALARAGGERDHGLAGRDADADVEAEGGIGRVELADRLADRERSAHAALGVVLVGQRGAEERHDRVADELLHGAAVALELGLQAGVVRRQHPAHVLGVELLGAAGEADEVGEEHA